MEKISPEQLDSALDGLLSKNEETAQAGRNIDTEGVHAILDKMDKAPNLPTPESPEGYPEIQNVDYASTLFL